MHCQQRKESLEPGPDMVRMLQLLDRIFQIPIINVLRTYFRKMDIRKNGELQQRYRDCEKETNVNTKNEKYCIGHE